MPVALSSIVPKLPAEVVQVGAVSTFIALASVAAKPEGFATLTP